MPFRRISAPVLVCLAIALVPLGSAGAQQSEDAPVALAARDLPRGAVLEAGDFVFTTTPAAVGPIGWMTKRVVTEGEPLRPPAIAPMDVVRSGDPVQLVWSSGGLELRVRGRAMGSAAIGETVRVRVDTRRRFEGTVLEAGVVLLDSPQNGRQR
ncbi:MAG: flagellar basal body P-ring formation chaperone FlgA [Gemmatimonadota bacterium]